MKIGIYNANIHTMGGGEKHIGVIAEYLAKEHEVEFLCSIPVDKELMAKKLNLDLSRVSIRALNVEHDDPLFEEESAKYDFFINSTYFSRLKSRCKKSAILIFFPWVIPHLYPIWFKKVILDFLKSTFYKNSNKMGFKLLDKLYSSNEKFFKTNEYLNTYQLVLTNSRYSQGWIKKELGIDSKIIYPPIDVSEFKPGVKQNIILSVGRFFVHSHNKKQYEMIKFFKEIHDKNDLKNVEYHLCGSVDKDELSPLYIEKCRKEAEGYPIFIHENISFPDLKELYAKAKVFWHASGYGENPKRNPDKFEHFGMTTVEAMAAGVIPIVIGRGGQIEIVEDGVDGFLWYTKPELFEKTLKVLKDNDIREKMMSNAIIKSKQFSKEETIKEIEEVIVPFIKS